MRIAAISDVHGNLPALRAVLADIRRRGCDAIVNLGEVAAALGDVDARLVLCGHTHVPRATRLGDGRVCVNPGSVGLPAFRGHQPHPHVMQSGTPAARYAMLHRDSGAWRAELLAVDHDPAPAERRARERGFGEWAEALRKGRLPSQVPSQTREHPP